MGFKLIYVLICAVLEEMLTCFLNFTFIQSIPLAIIHFLVPQYIKVHRTCKESRPHRAQDLVFPQKFPGNLCFVYLSMEMADWKKQQREEETPRDRRKNKTGLEQRRQAPKSPDLQKAKSSKLIYKLMKGKILLPVDTADP